MTDILVRVSPLSCSLPDPHFLSQMLDALCQSGLVECAPGRTFVDVGAAIGHLTLLAASLGMSGGLVIVGSSSSSSSSSSRLLCGYIHPSSDLNRKLPTANP
jgi:hypothetical protein